MFERIKAILAILAVLVDRKAFVNLRQVLLMLVFLVVGGFIGGFVSPYLPSTGNTFVDALLASLPLAVVLVLLVNRFYKKRR